MDGAKGEISLKQILLASFAWWRVDLVCFFLETGPK